MASIDEFATELQGYLQTKVDAMRRNLTESKSVATDNLRAGIDFEVEVTQTQVIGTIFMPTDEKGLEYWAFIDRGVSGTERSFDSPFRFKNDKVSLGMERSIARWMKAKYGVGLGTNAPKWQFYMLAKKVKRQGIEPTNFFSDEINTETLQEVSKMANEMLGIEKINFF